VTGKQCKPHHYLTGSNRAFLHVSPRIYVTPGTEGLH